MTYKGFEDLEGWRRSKELTIQMFKHLKGSKEYALKDQMIRASISIASNIAEGFERNSTKDFLRFLHISKGSAGELKTQLLIASKSGVINEAAAHKLYAETKQISSMLQGLINSLSKP